MKNFCISMSMFIYSTKLPLKRSHARDEMITNNSDVINNFHNQIKFDNFNNTGKKNNSPTSAELYQHNFKCKKQNNDKEDLVDFLEYLHYVDYHEPSKEELDKCTPVTLDSACLDKILQDKQDTSERINDLFREISKDERILCSEVKSFQNKNNDSKYPTFDIQNEKTSDFNCKQNKNLSEEAVQKKHLLTFKSYIENYITEKIPNSYRSNHLARIQALRQARIIFNYYKLGFITYFPIFEISHDKELLAKLKTVILSYDINLRFNQKTYNTFLQQFDLNVLFCSYLSTIRCKLEMLSDHQKILFFYAGLMKLYKYIVDIPELITLGGLFSDNSFFNLMIVMHLIYLFADSVDNLKDYRVYILCMIYKAFECFHGSLFNIFLITNYEFVCEKEKHDLTFFLWEFNSYKRQNIRIRKNVASNRTFKDQVYFKIIFLTFLYQHTIFIEYVNGGTEEVKKFQAFIDVVIKSKKCIGCLFNSYLREVLMTSKVTFLKQDITPI